MKWMRLKIVTGVKSFSKPEQPQPKKSKFLSAGARRATGIPVARNISPDPEVKRMPKEDG